MGSGRYDDCPFNECHPLVLCPVLDMSVWATGRSYLSANQSNVPAQKVLLYK